MRSEIFSMHAVNTELCMCSHTDGCRCTRLRVAMLQRSPAAPSHWRRWCKLLKMSWKKLVMVDRRMSVTERRSPAPQKRAHAACLLHREIAAAIPPDTELERQSPAAPSGAQDPNAVMTEALARSGINRKRTSEISPLASLTPSPNGGRRKHPARLAKPALSQTDTLQ